VSWPPFGFKNPLYCIIEETLNPCFKSLLVPADRFSVYSISLAGRCRKRYIAVVLPALHPHSLLPHLRPAHTDSPIASPPRAPSCLGYHQPHNSANSRTRIRVHRSYDGAGCLNLHLLALSSARPVSSAIQVKGGFLHSSA